MDDLRQETKCTIRKLIGLLTVLPPNLPWNTQAFVRKNRETYTSRHDYTNCISKWQLNTHKFAAFYSRYHLMYALLYQNPYGKNLQYVMYTDWDATIENILLPLDRFLSRQASFIMPATPVNFQLGLKSPREMSQVIFECMKQNTCCIPRPNEENNYWSWRILKKYMNGKMKFPPVNNGIFLAHRTQETHRVLREMMSTKISDGCDGCVFIKKLHNVSVQFFSETSFSTWWILNQSKPFVRHWGGSGSRKSENMMTWSRSPTLSETRHILKGVDPITTILTLQSLQVYHDRHGNPKYCAREYAKKEPTQLHHIPKVIYQTYFETPPLRIQDELKHHSPGFKYEFYDDKAAARFLETHYIQDVVQRFWQLSGAHRADLFRYCILYINGGYYFDVKTKFRQDLTKVFNKEARFYTVISIVPRSMYQGIIATTPGNPLLRKAIAYCLEVDLKRVKENYQLFTYTLYEYIQEAYSKELAVGRHHSKEWKLYLFQEGCTKNSPFKDRYGLDCSITDANGVRVFTTRHYDFPWKKFENFF
jgi:hypothetical protein